MPAIDEEEDVVAPPMDDEEGQGPAPVAAPTPLESAVLPPRPMMAPPPSGTGYTYSTNGPGNFATTQQQPVPWGGSVQLPGNAQNFGAMQNPVSAPGDQNDYWQRFQQAYKNLPLDQAQQAINAAVKYQGMRGYQRDIEAGQPADQTLAKWAPMIFADQKGGASALPKPNYQFQPGTGGAPATFQAPGQRPVIVPRAALPPAEGSDKLLKEEIVPGVFAVRVPGEKTLHIIKEGDAPLTDKDRVNLAVKLPKMLADVQALNPGTPQYTAATNALNAVQQAIKKPQRDAVEVPKKLGAKEIIRIAKNGRRAVFDADTKEFIRYAD